MFIVKKTIKIFLDSNVTLSGLLSDRGAPRIILDILSLGLPFLQGATGKYNLLEIERNIEKRLPAILDIYRSYLPKLRLETVPMPPIEALTPYWGRIAEKDAPILASAVMSGVDYLVTGDKGFAPLREDISLPLQAVSPSEYVALLGHVLAEDSTPMIGT